MEQVEKKLALSGKQKLFENLETYIELKIQNQITPADDELCDKLEKAELTLKNMINQLKWMIE